MTRESMCMHLECVCSRWLPQNTPTRSVLTQHKFIEKSPAYVYSLFHTHQKNCSKKKRRKNRVSNFANFTTDKKHGKKKGLRIGNL